MNYKIIGMFACPVLLLISCVIHRVTDKDRVTYEACILSDNDLLFLDNVADILRKDYGDILEREGAAYSGKLSYGGSINDITNCLEFLPDSSLRIFNDNQNSLKGDCEYNFYFYQKGRKKSELRIYAPVQYDQSHIGLVELVKKDIVYYWIFEADKNSIRHCRSSLVW